MESESTPTCSATASPPDRGTRPASVGAPDWNRRDLWLIAIIIAAFILRLVYVLQLQASPYFSTHVMDPQYHHEWAKAFASGETFWEGPYFRAPLYPWLLGTLYWLFGSEVSFTPRIFQALLGSLSCGLLYLIGRQVFSRTVGVIAGFAAAMYWALLYFDAELLIPVLVVFLDLLLLWLLLRTGDRRSPLSWGACGLVLGISALARPNILLLAPALVVWILALHRPRWRRALGYAVCLFVGCIAPILPVTLRNTVVGRDFVLIASQGGVNFYIGNNLHADGMSAVIKGDPTEWQPCYDAQIARAEKASGRPLRASEVSQWYFRQALRFMREQPGTAATLLLKKLGYFWSHWETSNNQDLRFITSNYTPIVRYLPIKFWLIGPLGVLGLLLCFRHAKPLFPLWGFVLIYLVSVVLFFVTARYRIPVAAVLILLGSHAACWLVTTIRQRRWRAVGGAALVLAGMGAAAYPIPPGVDTEMVQGYRFAGLLRADQGQFAEAEQLLSESVRRAAASGWRIDAYVWYYLGQAYLKLDRLADARECFENALQVDSDYPGARNNLACTLVGLGRLDEAARQFEAVVRGDPDNSTARANLARALAMLGRIDEALTHFRRAIEIDAAHMRNLQEVAELLRRNGKADDAARLLREVQADSTE